MAGSYRHVVELEKNQFGAPVLKFRGTESLDNLGDAYEALEEMHDMIEYLTRGNPYRVHEAWREGHCYKRIPDRVKQEPMLFNYSSFWRK